MPLDDLFEAIFEFPGEAAESAFSLLGGKKAKKKLKKAVKKSGGGAALASLGYFAFRTWQQKGNSTGKSAAPPLPPESDLQPPPRTLEEAAKEVPVSECLKMNMILAMIAAAGADRVVDTVEMDRLVEAIESSMIAPNDKSKLMAALNRPPLLEEVAALAFSPMEACELYGAALTAIEVDTPAERMFMRRFAVALKLDDDLVATIEETVRSI